MITLPYTFHHATLITFHDAALHLMLSVQIVSTTVLVDGHRSCLGKSSAAIITDKLQTNLPFGDV